MAGRRKPPPPARVASSTRLAKALNNPGPPQPFAVGDVLSRAGWFKPLHYSLLEPIVVLSVQKCHLCIGGWSVTVDTTAGQKEISASNFSLSRSI